MLDSKKSIGLYIHIPFCKAKCFYCDFNSFACMEDFIPAYFDALKKEIELYKDRLRGYTIKSIFIGGGTPSCVDHRYINELMSQCSQNFCIEENAEISIETNPGTLTEEKLTNYNLLGINRISMGLQAWQDRLLKKIGRIHDNHVFVENFNQARKAGFKNINVDLIFGLPSQSKQDWVETIRNILDMQPEHLSCYSLKIEDDTAFGRQLEAGELIPVEDELDREMYYAAKEMITGSGYEHYEISNFAKPGYLCKHNLIYWKAETYIGLGAGAHSYLEGKRFNNIAPVVEYIDYLKGGSVPSGGFEIIGREEEISEYMILGLRLTDGIDIHEFRDRFNRDLFELYGEQIKRLSGKNLLKFQEDKIMLTSKGLDLANEAFIEFLT